MCGIVGLFTPDRNALAVPQPVLEAMTQALYHRGPDDAGYFNQNGAALGFRRLSIIDLSPEANQPLFAADGQIVAVCNGEIYNYRDLRRDLEARGHRFRSQTDAEVVPALYAEYGDAFVQHLQGQFAIAIFDQRQQRLVLARDPIGIAPLFYTRLPGARLAFASEIKALLRHPEFGPRRVNLTALDQIFTFPGPISPHTLFAGIESLAPGSCLSLDATGRERRWVYWDLDYPVHTAESAAPTAIEPRIIESWVDELDAALRGAVQRRLQADVPVAAYLSGGLDSSLLAAIASDLTPDVQRHSFAITFPDARIDESPYQRLMAERLQTRHHTTAVDSQRIIDHLREIVLCGEVPLRESYNVCSLALSGLVQEQGLKVVLTGEGADELFGGYVGYRLDSLRPPMADDALEEMLEAQLREQLWGDANLYYEKPYHAHRETKAALYSAAVMGQYAQFDCLQSSPVNRAMLAGRHPLHQRSYLDFKLRMADHLLADHGDRVAFAHSVEARYPFLDQAVIDVARRMPPQWMVHDGQEKFILKQLARRYLPQEIIDRRKFSFVAPSSAVFLREAGEWVEDLLSYERIQRQGYFNPDTVDYLKTRYRSPGFSLNQTYDDDVLMIILTFGIALEAFELPDFS